MKPEKFNGHGSFETFLVQFENCCRYNGWNRRDKAAHLRWSLTGAAAQLLWGAEDLTYEELLEKLKKRLVGKAWKRNIRQSSGVGVAVRERRCVSLLKTFVVLWRWRIRAKSQACQNT